MNTNMNTKMLRAIATIAAMLLWLSPPAVNAQRGSGGPPASPGAGHGATAAPGQMGRPDMGRPDAASPGRSAPAPQGKPDSPPRQIGKGPEAGAAQGKAQRTPAEHLASNAKLSERVQALLPPGTSPGDAAAGFKNLGEFVAAAQVAHNLGIPFSELKSRIMAGSSLGEAVHALRPQADHRAEVKKAEAAAKKLMKESGV